MVLAMVGPAAHLSTFLPFQWTLRMPVCSWDPLLSSSLLIHSCENGRVGGERVICSTLPYNPLRKQSSWLILIILQVSMKCHFLKEAILGFPVRHFHSTLYFSLETVKIAVIWELFLINHTGGRKLCCTLSVVPRTKPDIWQDACSCHLYST